ncbi:MAG: hypothetical protein EBY42_09265 [Actinobacteria bacterium]|nr:hypothetical protein [Actinomycetota bacterium]
MRIATWNVNSIGARIERVVEWLESAQPDVVALQELKCTTEAFPEMPIQALGYDVAAHGNGRWNGVAILSRVGLDNVVLDLADQPPYEDVIETRAIGATCGGVRMWSLYVPNGREPDHEHYANTPFNAAVSDAYVDREARKGKGASDHAPVVVDLDIA